MSLEIKLILKNVTEKNKNKYMRKSKQDDRLKDCPCSWQLTATVHEFTPQPH